MRILIAILMLAAAAPGYAGTAMTYSFDPVVRALTLDKSGNQALVREYDGKQYDGAEADLKFSAAGDNGYVNMGVNALNSADEDGYFDINLGDYLAVRGKFNIMTHNHSFRPTGLDVNGVYESESARNPTGMVDDTKGAEVAMKRVTSEIKASVKLPGSEVYLLPGFWQENESGSVLARHSYSYVGHNVVQDVDRQTKELSMGIGAGIGNGAMVVDYMQRTFKDSSNYAMTPSGDYKYATRKDQNKTDLYDLRFRGNAGKMPVTGVLMARTRTNEYNGFVNHSYTANFGGQYAVNKKLAVTANVYGRTEGTVENELFVDAYYPNDPFATYGDPHIDHYNLNGKLAAAYSYSDKLRFSLDYAYTNDYRRHAENHVQWYDEDTTYYGGLVVPANTQYQGQPVQDTQNTIKVGVDADLPYDATLGVTYTNMGGNHAVVESLPTYMQNANVALTVPLPADLVLTGSADYLKDKNTGSYLANDKTYQNTYMGDLNWTGSSRYSMGVSYAYQRAKYYSDVYLGEKNHSYQGPTWGVSNLLFLPGLMYSYNNNVYGYHATVQLPRGFSLTGDGFYTISRSNTPSNIQPLSLDANKNALSTNAVTDYTPMDVRTASGGVTLKYMPKSSRNFYANLGFHRSQWIDKVVSTNSGWANVVNLTASAKF